MIKKRKRKVTHSQIREENVQIFEMKNVLDDKSIKIFAALFFIDEIII